MAFDAKTDPKRLQTVLGFLSRFVIEALRWEDPRRSRLVGAITLHPTRVCKHRRRRLALGYHADANGHRRALG